MKTSRKKRPKPSKLKKNEDPFKPPSQYTMTLRLPDDLNEKLEKYIEKHSEKKRQKKNVIVYALQKFLEENS